MLTLLSISLVHFKNYRKAGFDFKERIIGICGKNGMGKTNLLDAIHYLCFTKSYFTRQDGVNVHHGQQGFRIEGKLELFGKEEKAVCILRETGRKEFSINDEAYEKFSQHIGHYPCVIIAPDDVRLIIGASEERRTFIDTILSQIYPDYLQNLITYNNVLQQRNSLLRSYEENPSDQSILLSRRAGETRDTTLLDVFNEQLIKAGEKIFEKRKAFMVGFLPIVKKIYNEIANKYEDVTLYYESELLQYSFAELLQFNHSKDCLAMRTTSGIHRDDLEITLGSQVSPTARPSSGPGESSGDDPVGRAFKSVASQGQRKSLLFALKLAEMEVLKNEKGFAPLLLLDDVFEKLDEERIANLLHWVCVENQGQVFITDTNEERIRQHLKQFSVTYQLVEL